MDLYTARRLARRRGRGSRTSPSDYFEFGGGLNLVDTPLVVRPGQAVASENYEMGLRGGYERLGGFERFDGRDAPSDETYYVLAFRYGETLPPTVREGETFQDDTGADAGTVITVEYLTDPGYNRATGSEKLGVSTTGLDDARAFDVTPPTNRLFDVQPVGKHAFQSALDSGPTVPRVIKNFTENNTSGNHHFLAGIKSGPDDDWEVGDRIIVSCFMRQRSTEDRRYVVVNLVKTGPVALDDFASGEPIATFDLQTGSVESVSGGATSAYIEDVDYGNGWRRVVIETEALTASQTGPIWMRLRLMDDGQSTSYTGDATKGVYYAGPAYDRGQTLPSLTPYRSTSGSGNKVPAGIGYLVYRSRTVTPFAGSGETQNNLKDSTGAVVAFASGNEQEGNAPDRDDHLEYLSVAADAQRENLEKVPGGGPIRGVWFYGGTVYAFRDDAETSPTKCAIYKSTASGWTEITFAEHLDFDAGTDVIEEGDTVTGFTSGASAEVKRVNTTNDDWGGGTAAGTLVLGTITGGPFQDGEKLEVDAGNKADVDTANYVPTLSAGGTFEFRTYNFYGASDKRRMYGVNAQDRVFEYDDGDEVLASYRTGMANDAPDHIATHLYMLFLSFPGGSVQNSGVGNPAAWTVVTGASEIAVGDDCTGFLEEVADSLFIFTRNQKYRLTGRTVASFALDRFDKESGAIPGSIQRIGSGIYLDDFGFSSLRTSDRFGNYESNTFSGQIQPLIDELLENATVTASVIFRRRNRYRCFFDDGRFISIGLVGNKISGHMVCDYGDVVRAVCSAEDTDGTERLFFCSDDGYIYEAEKGTSFDGAPIRAGLRLHNYHSGAPDVNKRYRRLRVEARLDGPAAVHVIASFGSNNPALNAPNPVAVDLRSLTAGMNWDDGHEWELFDWDSEVDALEEMDLEGVGTDLGLAFYSESARERVHTLRGVNIHLAGRRIERSSIG